MDAVMKQKVENDAAAYMRSICAKRGRNSELAETAVRQSKSFTEKEALDQHLDRSDCRQRSRSCWPQWTAATITRFDGSSQTLQPPGVEIEVYERTLAAEDHLRHRRSQHRSHTAGDRRARDLCGILRPRPDRAGSRSERFCVLLGLSALSVLPINWLGAALLILSVVLFALEAKFTSHGILGAGAAVAMVLGAVMLVDSPVPEMRIHWQPRSRWRCRFPSSPRCWYRWWCARARNKIETGEEGMIGLVGDAVTALTPEGKVFVHGEYWDAVASRPVGAGARVRVTAIDRLKLAVDPVPDQTGG